ncbi:MAG: hypothetical protein AAF629_00325 [Chloroflexota bacterium]
MIPTINLMIGLPVEIMQDKREALAVLNPLRNWLVGEHHFQIENQPASFNILQVRALPQPVGTYSSWGINLNGSWKYNQQALQKPVAIADIGFNTLDLFALESGQMMVEATGGDTLGMHRVADAICKHVHRRYKVSLNMYKADQLMRDYLTNGQAILHHSEGETDLSTIIEQSLQEQVTKIVQFIRQHWDRGTQFAHLIITGGGAQALRPYLLKHFPQAIFLADPVIANAEGLAKYSLRKGLFSQLADHHIGLDPGFGGVKVAEVYGNERQLLTGHIPAVIGYGTTDAGMLSTGLRRRKADQPTAIQINETNYVVGSNVHLYAKPIERLDFQRLSAGPELQALLYVALWQIISQTELEAIR